MICSHSLHRETYGQMKADLLIKNGKIVTPNGIFNAGLAVEEGKIISIAKEQHLPSADKVIDAQENFVIPGTIDSHVHFWDPGYTYREDWRTGTMSAASGGVSTVIEMPTTSPPTITPTAFLEKKKNAGRKAYIDFALHAGTTPKTIEHIPALSNEGAASFKMFMAERVREFDNMNEGAIYEALGKIAKCNSVASLHAESELVPFLRKKLQSSGRTDVAAHLDSRPVIAENEAIFRALMLSQETKARVHVCHMTNAVGADLVQEAKSKKTPVSLETCIHYLLFNSEDYLRLGPYLKVNPPVRTKDDQLALWNALQNQTIDTLASDHCPFPLREKEIGWKDIWAAGTGVPGTETLLPLMISEGVNKRRINIQRLCQVLCENPARIFGLYPRKGIIAVGADADVTIVDMKRRSTIKAENMHTKAEFTPFEGWKIKGLPTHTFVRGNMIAEDGQIVGKEGYGKFVSRSD